MLTLSAPLRSQDDPASRREAIQAIYPVMLQAMEAKAFGRARNICEQCIMWEPQNAMHHYNLACIEAQAGRLPQAFGALQLAVTLGFNDPQHLRNDTDLDPLRSDPRFAELAHQVADNAFGTAAPAAANEGPPANSSPAQATMPAPNGFRDGRPVGLFFMTRFSAASGSLEKAAWYFSPEGTVFQNLQSGFSAGDLAAHTGPRGTCALKGNKLEVAWADGKKTSSVIKVSGSGTGFSWNAALFSAVKPFAGAAEAAGVFEGGESLVGAGGRAMISKRLELRPDGTFTWRGVSFATNATSASQVSVGGSGAATGKWELTGLSLTLIDASGTTIRRIAFPYDDEATPVKPDRMFFGGILYKKQ